MKDFKEILDYAYSVKDDFYIKDIREGLALSEDDFAEKGFDVSVDTLKHWENHNYKLSDLSSGQRQRFRQFLFGLTRFFYRMIYGDDVADIERMFSHK